MSVSKSIHLACDWPGCLNEVNTFEGLLPRARAVAAAKGWATVAGLDLCGPGGSLNLSGDAGHATHAVAVGHVPRTERAPNRRVHLSCACGWAYGPAIDAVLVGNRWRMHLEGAVLPTRQPLIPPAPGGDSPSPSVPEPPSPRGGTP